MKKIILVFVSLVFVSPVFAQHTEPELAYIKEVNLLRTNPKLYADFVRKHITNRLVDSVSKRIAIMEVIPLLDTMKPLPAYIISDDIRQRLNKFKTIDSINQALTHDISFMDNTYWKQYGQNLVQSPTNYSRPSIIVLLIDVQWKNRGHRKILLNKEFTHFAVRRIVFGDEKYLGCRIWWIQQGATKQYDKTLSTLTKVRPK